MLFEFLTKETGAFEAAPGCSLAYGQCLGFQQISSFFDSNSIQVLKGGLAGIIFEEGTQVVGVKVHIGRYLLKCDMLAIMLRHKQQCLFDGLVAMVVKVTTWLQKGRHM
jgi:hypothetical protein